MSILDSLFGIGRPRELLITDVTRMQADRVCIAGIDGKQTIRLAEPQPTRQLLAGIGNLAPGDVVRVKWERLRRYRLPHSEDCRWRPTSLQKCENLTPTPFYERLEPNSFATMEHAFGRPKYFARKGNPAYPAGNGKRSLASLLVTNLRVYRLADSLRADFCDTDSKWTGLPVEGITIRAHFEKCLECRRVGEMRAEQAILRVGLGRPFQPDGEQPGCFAQVNCVVPANTAGSHFLQENEP